jgi:hypothetical protein
MDDGQEVMKAQVCSLAFQIIVIQEEMMAMLDACLEKMEANPGELQPVAVHQEVPKEEVVEMIGALKDQYLAVGHHQQTKKRTHGDGGSQRKLAATRGQFTCRAVPAPCKGHGLQGPGRDTVARRALKGRALERRRWMHQECNSGVRDQNLKEQQHLRKERTSGRVFRKVFMLEIVK